MNSHIIPTDAWAQARERFVEDLDETDRAQFANATFENVFYSASAAQKIHEAQSVSKALAARTNALLTGINEWGKALDVYANASAMILCPLWGSIRVLIHLSSEFGKYFDCLIDMLAQIGELVPRFQIYERLFPSHLRLTQALSTAYLDVIVFCTMVKGVFKKAKRNILVNMRILLKVAWKSVDKQFGILMTRFYRHRKAVEKEAGISNLLKEAKVRDIESSILLQLEKQKDEEERIKLLSMLSSIQWEKQHWKAVRSRHENTGTWIFDTDDFKDWKDMMNPGCLYVYGIPGCGKTLLTAGVIEALLRNVDNGTSVAAYIYCDFADSSTLDSLSIIGTIIQQLLIVKPTIPEPIAGNIRELYGNGLRRPTVEGLIDLLCSVVEEYQYTYIIVDGVDEANFETQNYILSLITKITSLKTTFAKFFVSSRENSLISEALRSWPKINVSEDRTSQDVDVYIKASITEKLASHSVIKNNPGLQVEVEEELMRKAQGMFSWVFFQIEELSDPSHSKHSFEAALHDLPKGLTETYQRIYDKIIRKKSERQITLANKVFQWTVNARRSLTLSELQEAISIELGDEFWDRSKISTEPNGKRFLENCGALVLFDESDNTVRLMHNTVAQFLREHIFRSGESNHLVVDVCATYLCFSDFETQITLAGRERPIVKWNSNQSVVSRMVQLLGISKGVYDFLLNIYNRGERRLALDVDYVELLKRCQKQKPSVPFDEKYRLLSYIREHWIWHMLHLNTIRPKSWSCLRELVFTKTLPFDFRPWDTTLGIADTPHVNVFLWALEAAHLPLFTMLKEIAPLKRYSDYIGTKHLERLLHEGHRNIIELLLLEDVPPAASYGDLLHRALLSRHVGILRLILFQASKVDKRLVANFMQRRYDMLGNPLGYSRDVNGSVGLQPLHFAAYEGNLGLSRLLLVFGAEVDGFDSVGRTPFVYACCSPEQVSHHDVIDTITLLLEQGANVDAADVLGDSPLQHVVRQGPEREIVVETLIARDANLYNSNHGQESIFDTAIWHAPVTVMRLLRLHGLDLEVLDNHGMTPLIKVLESGHLKERAIALIASGANVNTRCIWATTALHIAVANGCSIRVLNCLLDAGAEMYARDSNGRLAIDHAVALSSTEKVVVFIDHGMDLNQLDSRWEPALIHPIRHGNDHMVEILLAGGMDPNTMDHGDPPKTALTCAVIFHSMKIAEMLLYHGAKVQPFVVQEQADPFYWAVIKGSPLMLRLLVRHLKDHEKDRLDYLWRYIGWRSRINTLDPPDLQKDRLMTAELQKLGIPQPDLCPCWRKMDVAPSTNRKQAWQSLGEAR